MSTTLSHKIDFAAIFFVDNANPNGDPLNGNRPRAGYDEIGEVTDVCLKRKIRDRLQEMGEAIFVQSDDRKNDDAKSLQSRASAKLGDKFGSGEMRKIACDTWFDVRTFGQLFAYTNPKKKARKKSEGEESSEGDSGVSIGIRGPVTIQSAFSLKPIEITGNQIVKSVDGEDPKEGKSRSSDRMGMKYRVNGCVAYAFYGSMNPQLAKPTGFSDADAEKIKIVLPCLFKNDESSARPAGSMKVHKVVWWEHNSEAGQYSPAKVHESLRSILNPDGTFDEETLKGALKGLVPEIIDGC